jgi:hypothetical protein
MGTIAVALHGAAPPVRTATGAAFDTIDDL